MIELSEYLGHYSDGDTKEPRRIAVAPRYVSAVIPVEGQDYRSVVKTIDGSTYLCTDAYDTVLDLVKGA